MHPSPLHLLLALLSFSLFKATLLTTALPHTPHPNLPATTLPPHHAPPIPPFPRRGILPPGFSSVKGLPPGFSGIFTTYRTTRPSIPISSVFIRFFRVAASVAAKDPIVGRWFQRFAYGVLVLEMWAVEEGGFVSREFVQATSLWLMDAALKGWTGLFEAWVRDDGDGEMVFVRLATIWDLPMKESNSPWD